ncbi:carboxypeptidase-like protein [Chryseobacterium sp. 52]|uniref:outer membrane beta-barrel protein n=1 Tax=Chryseobacterium sp. 52 TaxID=2035213 RepID=UPI000C17B637|nr:outer membrane beta-barrel protein [Chryseobacterium sp. 52]PIF45305.1 carboxypeptidase-like protein [Chryseobacterium sp. 52]
MMAQIRTKEEGSIKGLVKDTVNNIILKKAAVSVFKFGDSVLINFQLTNAIGEFHIQNLPLDQPLQLTVSFMGYRSMEKSFTISSSTKILDFKTLELTNQVTNLKEVVIRSPVVSVNNDTLEINTSAFKLDPNAVIEDVLRKTPGVVLWADGNITVNGKPVKRVLVDGKDFFGGDPKIALQNLSKTSISKIQIYNEKNNYNVLDSNLIMNLKLKGSQKKGAFGKIGVGIGSRKHYDADGNINFYTPKLQLALIGASNNVNKFTSDAQTLLVNSTFKGVGAHINYQSDFKASGLNKTSTGGLLFSYDFIEHPDYDNKQRLAIDYFGQNKDFQSTVRNQTRSSLSNNNQIYTNTINSNSTEKINHDLSGKYEDVSPGKELIIEQTLKKGSYKDRSNIEVSSFNNYDEIVNSNNTDVSTNKDAVDYQFQVEWLNKKNLSHSPFNKSRVKYLFSLTTENFDSDIRAAFTSFYDPQTNEKHRKYDNNNQLIRQNLMFNLPRLYEIGNEWYVGFNNDIVLSQNNERNNVSDFSKLDNQFTSNTDLTNKLIYNTLDEKIGFYLNKTISKRLSNRYAKSIELTIGGVHNFTKQSSSSKHDFQNIRRNYNNFFPTLSIALINQNFGLYSQNITFNFKEQIDIPQLSQLAPLVDDIDVTQLRYGNLGLKEARQKILQLSFQHIDLKQKNTFNISAILSGSFISNAFVDSTTIDTANRISHYTVNAKKMSRFLLSVIANKSFKLKNAELQLKFTNNVNFNSWPSFVNGSYLSTTSILLNNKLALFYRYKELLALEAGLGYSPSVSKQIQFGTKYKTSNYTSSLSASFCLTKNITINSNVDYIKNTSNVQRSNNYLVWNANLTLRFLKLNNGEIKFASYDILRQNTNLINSTGSNFISIGSQNVLQNYFMTTISYYPRFFKKP